MTDTTDPIEGITALLAERDGCEARIKEINEKLEEIRRSIDRRTTAPRRPRLVTAKAAAVAATTPEPPEAA